MLTIIKNSILVLFFTLLPAIAVSQGLGENHRQPIEINADSLEIKQEENLAIFTGNVQTTQGEILLLADKVSVEYFDDGNEENAIKIINMSGNVFFSTPRETAEGENGIYDVENSIITLIGAVIITQGPNVLRGNRLSINLINGITTIEGEPDSENRVRGLFIPNQPADPSP